MSPKDVILAIIATAILAISLPIIVGALVTAGAVAGVSANFTSALEISQLVLGFAPIGILLTFLIIKKVRG
mgnify:CR=1 FL=1